MRDVRYFSRRDVFVVDRVVIIDISLVIPNNVVVFDVFVAFFIVFVALFIVEAVFIGTVVDITICESPFSMVLSFLTYASWQFIDLLSSQHVV